MGNFFRRILAFILGIVFCVTASVGGIVGGAYWAYKNLTLSKVGVNDPSLGDLTDQPIEDLVDLIINGAKDPSSYTFAELEKKYGVKLEDILSKFGLKVEIVTKDQELNFKALKDISVFTLFDKSGDGINLLLDSLSARALFNFFPDSFLSPGTRAQLSVYSVADLINKEETTGKLGLYSALNSAKVGGVLPTVFEEKYNQSTHTYEYEVKEDKNQALTLVKDMEVGAFIKTFIDGDSDILTELNSGGLSSIGDMQISEVFSTIAGAFSASAKEAVEKYGQILAGKTVRDLFVLTENGKYSFALENLFNDIKLGYIFGYKEVDGVWYDGDKVANGVLAVLSDVNLYNIVKGISESKVKDAIISELGIINLGDIFEQFLGYKQENGQWVDANGKAMPKILQGLAGVSVAQIFDEDAPIIDNIINALDESFGDITAGDVLADFVGFKKVDEQWVDEKGNELNPILSGLLSMKIADLIRKEYTLESIVGILKEAIGDVKAGEILGYTFDGAKQIWVDSNGNPVNAYINVLCGMDCNNVLDIFLADDSPANIVRTFLGDIKMGDLLVAVLKYSYDEESGKWLTSKGNEVPAGVAKLAEIKLWQFVAAFDKNEPFNLYDMLDGLTLGDFIGVYDKETDTYTITADIIPSLKGKVLSGVLSTLLNIDIGHFLDAKTENDEYVQILKNITIGQVVQAITGYAQNAEGDWIAPEGKNTDRLLELLCSIRLSVNDVVELIQGKLTASEFVSKLLGELKVGDFLGSAFGLHYDTATNSFVDKNNEKTYDLYDFLMNINANDVIAFIETKDVLATIKEFISPLQIGDFFAPFMKLKEQDGIWTRENGTQRLIHILESVFNLYLTHIIDEVETIINTKKLYLLDIVSDVFGETTTIEYYLDFVKLPDNEVLAQIVDIVIYDLVNDLMNESDKAEVLLKYFGEWTIGEALDGVLPARIANNQLTQNIFALSVHSIYTDIIKSSDVLTALEEKVFGDVSLSTLVSYALEDQSKLPTIVKDLLALEINYIIDNVRTAVDTGNVYIGNIVKTICGERTIKDYLQDFVKLPDNEVLNQVTGVVISDFVADLAKDDKAEVILEYFGEWTIGQALKGLLPKNIEENQLTQNVFALSLYAIYTQIVKADDVLMALEEKVFGGVSLSTLVSYAVSDQSKFPNIAKDLLALEVNYIIDTVKTAVKDQTVYLGNIINKICKGRTIADYVEDFVKLPDNKALNQIKSVVICDFYNDLINSSDKAQVILEYFGNWTLGEALGKETAQQGEITTHNAYDVSVLNSGKAARALVNGTTVEAGNKFTENMYALSALSVYTDIIKADDVLAAVEEKVFDGVNISMIAAYAIANQSGLPNIVKDIFAVEVNYIIDTVKTAIDTGIVYVADIVGKVCGDSTIGDYLDFVELPDNEAVNKISSVVIRDFVKELFNSSDKTDVVLNAFGTWTVGDAIDGVLPARLKENQFIKNVIGISAKTFYSDILKSSDVLDSVRTKILNEVKFSTLLALAIADQSKLPNVAKDLLNVELNFVVDIIKIKDMNVSTIVKTICGDSTIGDYIKDFVKLPDNEVVNKVTSVVISAFVEDIINKSDKVQVIIDYFGTWTIGEVLNGVLPKNIEENRLTQNLFALSAMTIYTDIIKASDILAAVQDKVFDGVKLSTLLAYAMQDQTKLPTIAHDLLGVEINYIINIIKNGKIDVADTVAYVCGTHTIGNYVQDFVKLPDKALLNAVQNVSLSELANLIFGGNFTTAKLAEFVKNTVNGNETVGSLVYDLIGMTNNGGIYYFSNGQRAFRVIQEVFGINVVELIKDAQTYLKNYASYDFEDILQMVGELEGYEYDYEHNQFVKEPILAFVTVGVAGVALYFLANDVLVDLAGDMTYLDLISKIAGREENGKYIFEIDDGVETDSPFYNKLITKKIGETLKKGYDFLGEFKDVLGIGNVVVPFTAEIIGFISSHFTPTYTVSYTTEENGEITWKVVGEYGSVISGLYNVTYTGLEKAIKDKTIVDYVIGLFKEVSLGDVSEKFLPEKIKTNKLFANVLDLTVGVIYYDLVKGSDRLATIQQYILDGVSTSTLLDFAMTKEKQDKLPRLVRDLTAVEFNYIIDEVKTVIDTKKLYLLDIISNVVGETTTIKDYLDFVKLPDNDAVNKVTAVVIYEFAEAMLNSNNKTEVILDYFGTFTFGDVLKGGLPKNIEDNQLTQNIYALSALIIYEDIVKADDKLAAIEEKVLDKVSLSTLLAYAVKDQSMLPTIAKDVLALEINFIIDTTMQIVKDKVVYVANIVGKLFGERTIGDYLQDFVTIPGNRAIVKLTNIVIYDFVMELLNSNDKVQTLLDYFGSWTVGDLFESGLPADIEENQFTQNVYKLSALIIYNEIVKASDILAAIEEKVFDNVTLSNLLAYAVKDQSKLPNIAKDLLALEVNYIIDTVKQIIKDKVVYVANIVSKICGERTIGDYLDFLTLPDGNAAVEKVTSVVIYDLVTDLLKSNDKAQVLLDYFGTIRIGEVIAEATGYVEDADFGVWIRKENRNLKAYTLLEIAYDLALNDVLGFLLDGKFKANDIADFVQKIVQGNETVGSLAYDLLGMTYTDGKYYFENGQRAYRIVAEAFGLNVVELIKNAQTYLKNYASYELDDIVQMIGELEGYTYDYKANKFTKTPVLAYVTLGAIGAVMYFVANDVLVDLAGDMTYFDAFKDTLNVSENSGKYIFAGTNVDTPLYNKLMPKKIGETLKKGYDFKGEFKDVLGVGNLAAVFTDKLGKYTVSYTTEENGEITWNVAGNYGSVISGLYNVTYNGLEKAIKDKKVGDYVLGLFGEVSVGDLTVQIIPEKIKTNKLVENVNAITVNTVYNKFVKGNDKLAAIQENVFDKVSTSTLLEFVMTKEAQDKLPRLVRDLAAVEFNYVINEVKTVIDTKKLYLLDIISEVIGKETTVRDYLDFVKLPNNDVVNKVTAVVIYEFAEAMFNSTNKEEVILDYFGTWTIGDVLYNTLPKKIENNQLTQNVYALSALIIYKDIVKANDKLAAIEDVLFTNVTLSTLLAYAMEDQSKLPTIVKDLLGLEINFIIDTTKQIVKDKVVYVSNIANAIFGERTIGDYAKDFVKLPNNKAINAITSVVIYDFVMAMAANKDKVQVVLDYFGTWTIGDLLTGSFNKTVEENQLTQNVFALSTKVIYNDIVKASDVLTAVEEKVFDKVALSTLLAYAMEDQSKLPTIVKDVLAVEVNYIIDTVKESSKTGIVYVADIVKEICGDRTINDYVKDFAKLPDNAALNSVTSTVISTFVADLFNSDDKAQVLVDAFADWRIGDAIGGLTNYAEDEGLGIWVTKKDSNVKANAIVEVAFDISVKKVLEFLLDKKFDTNSIANFVQETLQGNETVGSLAYDLLGMTYTDGKYYFENGQRAYRIVAEAFGLNVVELIKNAQTYLKNYASYELDDIVQMIGELEGYTYDYKANKFTKTPVLAYVTLGAIGAVMYFVANDVLVDLAGDMTYFDAFKDTLNVSENSGKYIFAGTNVDTPLYNKLMPKKIGETLKKGYDFKGEFKDVLGVGNLAAVFTDKLGKYTVSYTTEENGEITWNVAGNYGSVISGLYNVTYNGLEKAIKDKKVGDYVLGLFGEVSVGDLTVQIIPEKIKTNKLVENVNAITVNTVYNKFVKGNDKLAAIQENVFDKVSTSTLLEFVMTKEAQDKLPRLVRDLAAVEFNYVINEVKTVIDTKKLYLLDIISEVIGKETTVRDYLDFVKLPNNDVVNKVTAVVIYEFAEAMFNSTNKEEVILDYFGTWTIGDVLYNTLPKKIENNQLTQNVYALSALIIYKDIVKANDKLAAIEDVLFTNVTLSTLLAYAMEDQSKLPTIVKDLLGLEINFIIDTTKQIVKDKVVYVSNIANAIFGERTIGDYAKDFVKLPNNKAINAITSVVIYDFVMAMAANKDKVQVVLDYFGTWTIGDLLTGSFNKTVEENQLTQNVFALSTKVIYNDIVKASDVLTAVEEKVFDKVALSTLLAYAMEDQSKLPTIVKDVLAVEVNYIIDTVKQIAKDKVVYVSNIVNKVFGERTIGDYAKDFVKLPNNKAINKITNVVVYDFVMAMAANKDRVQVVLDYFGTWTIGDLLEGSFNKTTEENQLTQNVFALSAKVIYNDIVKANDKLTAVKGNVFTSVTLSDILAYAVKDQSKLPNIAKDILAVEVNYVIDETKSIIDNKKLYLLDIISEVSGETKTVKDYLDFVKLPDNKAVNKATSVVIYDFVDAMLASKDKKQVVLDYFGTWTIGEAFGDKFGYVENEELGIWITKKDANVKANTLTETLFDMQIKTPLSFLLKGKFTAGDFATLAKEIVNDNETIGLLLYDMFEMKYVNNVYYFKNGQRAYRIVTEVFGLNVIELIKNAKTYINGYAKYTFDDLVQMIGELEGYEYDYAADKFTKTPVLAYATLGAIGVGMYYGANSLLVKVCGTITYYSALKDVFKITRNGEDYLLGTDKLATPLFNKVLPLKLSETLKKGYDLKGLLKDVLSIGNLTAMYTSKLKLGGVAALNAEQKWTVSGKYGNVIAAIYNVNLFEANDAIRKRNGMTLKSYLLDTFDGIVAGDLLAPTLKAELKENVWYKDGKKYLRLYNDLLNTNVVETIRFISDAAKSNSFNLRQLLYLMFTDDATVEYYFGQILKYSVNETGDLVNKKGEYANVVIENIFKENFINFIVTTVKNVSKPKTLITDILGDAKIGDIVLTGYRLNASDEWVKADGTVYAFSSSLAAIEKVVYTIKIADLVNGFNVESIFGDMYIGELLGYTKNGEVWTGKDGNALAGFNLKLANITIKKLTETEDPLTLFNDMYIGELLGYTQNGEDWYNGTEKLMGFNLKLAGITIEQLTTTEDALTLFGDVYVGEILGYTKNGTIWMKGNAPITSGFELVLADITINQLIGAQNDPLTLFGDVYIGDIIGYTSANEEKTEWLDQNNNAVKGFNLAIAKLKISQISGTSDILTLFGDLQIGEIFGYTYENGKWQDKDGNDVNALVNAIASIKISDTTAEGFDLMNTVRDVKLGDVMGYTYDTATNKWIKAGAEAEALIQIIANYTIGGIQDGNFSSTLMNDITGTVTIKDIFKSVYGSTDKSGMFALLSEDDWNKPVGQLETIMTGKMSNLVVADLAKLGVISDINKVVNSRVAIIGVDSLIKTDAAYSNYEWTSATYSTTTGSIETCSMKLREKGTTGDGTYWTEIVKLSDFFDVVFNASL